MARGKEKLWTLGFVLITLITFIASLNGNGVHNGVSLLIEDAGKSSALAGFIAGWFSFAALVARIFSGSLSDRFGRKPILLGGTLMVLVGNIVGIFSPNVYFLLPCRVFMALGFSAVITCAAAATADIVPASRMGEGLSYQGLAFALSSAVGPSVAIVAAAHGGKVLFGVFGILTVLAVIFDFMIKLPEQPKPQPAPKVKGERRGFVQNFFEPCAYPAAIVTLVFGISLTVFMAFMSLYAQREGIGGASWFFVIAAAVMIIIRVTAGSTLDRFKPNTLLVPAILLGIAAFLVMAIFNNFPAMMAAAVLYGICNGFCQPIMTAEALRTAPPERRGAASATYFVGVDLGIGIGSFMWGAIIAAWGFRATFVLAAAIFVVDLVLCLVLFRNRGAEISKDEN